MSYRKPLAERERALEDAFFRKETERLLEAMRTHESRDKQLEALSGALGIKDNAVLGSLVDLGLRDSNIAALVLAPLVSVAWADGTMDNDERRLIINAEIALGVQPESGGAKLVDVWLAHRPHASLIDAWSAYIGELCKLLTPADAMRLRDDIVSRSKRIAKSIEKSFLRAGGPTDAERAVLSRIEEAFSSALAE